MVHKNLATPEISKAPTYSLQPEIANTPSPRLRPKRFLHLPPPPPGSSTLQLLAAVTPLVRQTGGASASSVPQTTELASPPVTAPQHPLQPPREYCDVVHR